MKPSYRGGVMPSGVEPRDMMRTAPAIASPGGRDLATTEEIIDDARNGRMFILVEDEGRENEGDLVIPAQMATPIAINFMATHGRG